MLINNYFNCKLLKNFKVIINIPNLEEENIMKSYTVNNQERKSRSAVKLEEDKLSSVTGGTGAPDHSEMAGKIVSDMSDKDTTLKDLGVYAGSVNESDHSISLDEMAEKMREFTEAYRATEMKLNGMATQEVHEMVEEQSNTKAYAATNSLITGMVQDGIRIVSGQASNIKEDRNISELMPRSDINKLANVEFINKMGEILQKSSEAVTANIEADIRKKMANDIAERDNARVNVMAEMDNARTYSMAEMDNVIAEMKKRMLEQE
jgi:hypothetical protein